MDKTINDAANQLLRDGFTLKFHNRHPRLQSPDGKVVITVPKTPSDHRASKNFISQLRRKGLL